MVDSLPYREIRELFLRGLQQSNLPRRIYEIRELYVSGLRQMFWPCRVEPMQYCPPSVITTTIVKNDTNDIPGYLFSRWSR